MWENRKTGSGMLSRYWIGFPFFIFGLAVVVLRGPLLTASSLVFMLIGEIEMYSVLRRASLRPGLWVSILMALLIYPVYLWKGAEGVMALYTALVSVSMVWAIFLPQRNYIDIMASILLAFYPVLPMFLLILIGSFSPEPFAVIAIGIAVFSPVLTDIFSFFAGRYFGKHPLNPVISPKKTLEGAIGGLVMSTLLVAVAGWFVWRYYSPAVAYYHYILLGFLTSVFGQLGDLTASAIKRFAGAKDFGTLLLGHGGLLDRLDSILLGGVAVYAYFTLFIL